MNAHGGLVELWGVGADGRAWHLIRLSGGWQVNVMAAARFGLAPLADALAWVREVCG